MPLFSTQNRGGVVIYFSKILKQAKKEKNTSYLFPPKWIIASENDLISTIWQPQNPDFRSLKNIPTTSARARDEENKIADLNTARSMQYFATYRELHNSRTC